MTRATVERHLRWLAASAMLLLLSLSPSTVVAAEEDEECGEASTPELVITAVNAGKAVPRLTLSVRTDKAGTPNWNVIFRSGTSTLQNLEVHRVFLKAHEEESSLAVSEDECGGGGGCDEDDAGMTSASIRGLGYINGEQMRVQIDLKDYGNSTAKPDQIRIRWRPYDPTEEGHGESGDCGDTAWSNNSWFPVQQITIHLR